MIEVHDKRKHLRHLGHDERKSTCASIPIPAVLGRTTSCTSPTIIIWVARSRREHRARLLHGRRELCAAEPAQFWQQMDARRWVHPIDHTAAPRTRAHPQAPQDLLDDPYRSLAGYVRNPRFSEDRFGLRRICLGDFFRNRLPSPQCEDFDAALRRR